MKLFKKFSWIFIFTLLCTMIPISNTKATTNEMNEEGIKIGTVIYDYDEYGNITERVIDGKNAITEEEQLEQYYSKFIGNGNISLMNETTDTVEIITENTTFTDRTITKDIYISQDVTLTTQGTVSITGNVYVFGTLKNTGNLTVTGSLYCLNYGDQKAGEYTYGYLINETGGTINCPSILVQKDYLEAGIPLVYNLISIAADGTETIIKGYTVYNEAFDAYEDIISENPSVNYAIKSQDTYWNVKYAVVVFPEVLSNGYVKNISYTEDGTSTSGYMNPSYGIDGAYLETKNNKVKFRLSNVTAWVDESKVQVVPYADKTTYVNYYKVVSGKLYHYTRYNSVKANDDLKGAYSSGCMIGKAPSILKENVAYYSYDGTYFYLDYFKMIDDYRAGTHSNAINKDNPHYNYYQYLSHRTKTVYTADQVNKYINYYLSNTSSLKNLPSKMKDSAKMFLDNQTLYGANALLTIGVAVNESTWGTSTYAINKNNLFGHAAYDSNPDNATGYSSVNESIKYHTQIYVSRNYCSPTITENNKVVLGSTYFSANLGDKGSGMNIRYASDPYWGEKNARFAYQIDNYFGNKDYGRYTIGVKNVVDTVNIRKEPTSNSTKLYTTEDILDVPFIILGEVKGQSHNGSDIWYKIQSDAPLKEDRSSYTTTNDTYRYDYVNSYAYIHSSYVDIVFEGNATIDYSNDPIPEEKPEVTPPTEVTPYDINAFLTKAGIVLKDGYITSTKSQTTITNTIAALSKIDATVKVEIDANGHEIKNDYIGTDMILKISTPDDKTYAYTYVIKGDVNGDGNIFATDYVKIKNHIMGKTAITGSYLLAADVNNDGNIYATDYVKIKNHIMGKSPIE